MTSQLISNLNQCSNGHPTGAGHKFCVKCGEHLSSAGPTPGALVMSDGPDPSPGAKTEQRRFPELSERQKTMMWLTLIGGLFGMVVVAGLVSPDSGDEPPVEPEAVAESEVPVTTEESYITWLDWSFQQMQTDHLALFQTVGQSPWQDTPWVDPAVANQAARVARGAGLNAETLEDTDPPAGYEPINEDLIWALRNYETAALSLLQASSVPDFAEALNNVNAFYHAHFKR
jgi:hypothetical protein